MVTMFLFFACSSPKKEAADILIVNGNIINLASGKVDSKLSIALRNDSIIYIGESGSKFQAKQTIDASGQYIIPGLWDMHVHFRGGENLIGENKDLLPLFIANGVTGVREAGGDMTSKIFQWRKQIEAGTLVGPKIFTSGPKLDGPRGSWAGSIPVSNVEEVTAAVDSLENMGVDFIKIYDSTISREVYIAIIKEAKKRGIATSGHMPFSVRLKEAVSSGIGSIEHLYYILKGTSSQEEEITQAVINGKAGFWGSLDQVMATYDENQAQSTFSMLKAHNTYVVPTMHISNTLSYLDRDNHENDPYLQLIGEGIIQSYRGRVRSAMRASQEAIESRHALNTAFRGLVPKLNKAGVPLLAGSDSGASNSYVYQGISLHQELAALVEAGLSPIEALKTATINGARFFNVDDFYGTVEEGKSSDLLILDANPLEDITNTQKINTLILGNRVFAKSDLENMLENIREN